MNRLLKKIREFGLIIPVDSADTEEIISISRSLKKAHIPLVLFPYDSNQETDRVRISNENEDMFIGARCSCSYEEVSEAFSSGAHFAICPPGEEEEIKSIIEKGLDLFISVKSIEEIDVAASAGAVAVLIEGEETQTEQMVEHCVSQINMPFILSGIHKFEILNRWRNHQLFIAALAPMDFQEKKEEEIISRAFALIHDFLGLRYRSLRVREDSEQIDQARTFAALSAIPLFVKDEEERLEIEVKDMDRTIAHLKWRNIFIDPFNTQMNGDSVLSTELYTPFLGWPVRLIRHD